MKCEVKKIIEMVVTSQFATMRLLSTASTVRIVYNTKQRKLIKVDSLVIVVWSGRGYT